MSPTTPRNTFEGSIYNDLRNLAKCKERDPAEYLTLYALEGFLAHLESESPENFDELLQAVIRFADPTIKKGKATNLAWDPVNEKWF